MKVFYYYSLYFIISRYNNNIGSSIHKMTIPDPTMHFIPQFISAILKQMLHSFYNFPSNTNFPGFN